jgi:hypothetical protein
MKDTITQSMIKDVEDYMKNKQCGNILKHKFLDDQFLPPTDIMKLGQYFEYKATGQLPKDGVKPEPELTKTGLMTAAYKRAAAQAQHFQHLCEKMGIHILETGQKRVLALVQDGQGVWHYEGTCDFIAEWDQINSECVFDLKYSGLLNDKWNEWGWGALGDPDWMNTKQFVTQMENKKTQALHYSKIWGLPFFYWVFSSAPGAEETGQNLLFEMKADDFQHEQHQVRAKLALDQFNTISKIGFDPLPEYNRCKSCELHDQCTDKVTIPEPIVVQIQTAD